MRKIIDRDEQGEFGIGSLIIFIAMIIVAAVTATVLIQTAYQLQQQAEQTGQTAVNDVSMGVKVLSMGGYRYNASWGINAPYQNTINWIDLKITLIAGSPPISVADIIIEVSDGNISTDLHFNSSATFNAGAHPDGLKSDEFGAGIVRDMAPESWDSYTITSGDVVSVFFNATAVGLSLEPQTYLTIKIIPKHGVPTLEEVTTPSPYVTRYVGLI